MPTPILLLDPVASAAGALVPGWWSLARHDDGDDGDPGDDSPDDGGADGGEDGEDPEPRPTAKKAAAKKTAAAAPADDDGEDLGPAGKKALQELRRQARDADRALKAAEREAAELRRQNEEYADKERTEKERLEVAAQRAEERAQKAVARAAAAQLERLAVKADFADPEDAVLALGDLTSYLNADGELDADAVSEKLADVLERRPHWRKAAAAPVKPVEQQDPPAAAPQRPARKMTPDPAAGGRGGTAGPDFTNRDTLAAELAKFGLRTTT